MLRVLPGPACSSSGAGELPGQRQQCASADTRASMDSQQEDTRESPEAAPVPGWNPGTRSSGHRLPDASLREKKPRSSSPADGVSVDLSGLHAAPEAAGASCCRSRGSCCRRNAHCCCRGAAGPTTRCHCCCSRRRGCSTHLPKWQKILWKKQPHPDCYVDETFLNTLMRNRNLTRYIYSELCQSTVVLTQHLSCILIFLLIYRMIVKRSIEASTLVIFDVFALPLGYALRWSLRPAPRELLLWTSRSFEANRPPAYDHHQRVRFSGVCPAARQVLQSGIIVFGVLRILAPVLQTLTQSFSDDTVISLTSSQFFGQPHEALGLVLRVVAAVCLLIHIPFNDYSYVYRNPGTIDEPLGRLMSLNVALFANILLASRLSTSTEVFAFLFFGIEVFALSPMARRYLLLWNPWACTYVATPLLILLTSGLMYIEGSASNVVLYLFLMFFITFVGPYWLIRSQKYKK